jgi:hypothetical protein
MPIKKPRVSKKVKNEQQRSNTATAVVVGYTDKIQNMPNLLLAYLYHLNNEYSKYIAFGYSSTTLEPTVIVHTIGLCFIELDCIEYTNLVLLSDKIHLYFNTETTPEPVNNRYMDIKFGVLNGEKYVTFERLGNTQDVHKFKLNEAEWTRMYELMVFFNALTLWYKNSANDVKTYYQHYLKLCCDNNRLFLTTQEFYTPNDIPNGQFYTSPISFNYSRLFYEIGIFCRQNIFDKCLQNLYSTIS